MATRIRYGMVGGGEGAFIGAVHRSAAALDGEFDLVAGAFSSRETVSRSSGDRLGLPAKRVYGSYDEMFEREAALPPDRRIEAVSIVTPNHTHFDIASKALRAGFHVICDKPLTHSLDDALRLRDIVAETGLVFALTHNYTGYPLVKHARTLIAQGRLGALRKVVVEYSQGWLATKVEETTDLWRADPARSGICGCMGDIGTHAFNLLEYVTGLDVTEVSAELTTFVPGRALDDDGNVLVRMEQGVRGLLFASQVSVGEENNLSLRVYGERGSLRWAQQQPNQLLVTSIGGNDEIVRPGVDKQLSSAAMESVRLPGGHPEGFIEAFANIYRAFGGAVRAHARGEPIDADFPTVEDGVRGMAFQYAVVKSSGGQEKWTPIDVEF